MVSRYTETIGSNMMYSPFIRKSTVPGAVSYVNRCGATITELHLFCQRKTRRSKVNFAPMIFYKNLHSIHSLAPPHQTATAALGRGLVSGADLKAASFRIEPPCLI